MSVSCLRVGFVSSCGADHVFVSVYMSLGYHVFVSPSFTWDSGNIFPPVAPSCGVDYVFVSVSCLRVGLIISSCRFTCHGLSRLRVAFIHVGQR